MVASCAVILFLPDLGPEKYTDLATLFKNERARQATIGYSVAVCRNGSVIYQESFGTDGAGHTLNKRTPMYLGPSSEVLSGALLYSLALQGKINLEENIWGYLPSIPRGKSSPQKKSLRPNGVDDFSGETAPGGGVQPTITVRDMADQSTRLSDELARAFSTTVLGYEAYEVNPSDILKSGQRRDKITHNRLSYRVLGAAMENAGKDSFDALLQAYILQPLGMRRTTARPDAVQDAAIGSGHFFGLAFPYSSRIPSLAAPADGISTTTEDMAKFLAYITAPPSKGIASLPPSSVAGLYQPLKKGGNTGFGWKIAEAGGNRTVYHGGSVEGFSSRVVIWPERNAGIIVLAPQGGIVESSIVLPMLTQAAEAILFSGSSPRLFPVSRVLILLGIALLLYSITLFSQTSTAHSWAKGVVDRQETGTNAYYHRLITIKTSVGLLVRAALLAATPAILGAIFGRSFTYHDLMVLEPGTSTFFILSLLAGSLRNITRLVWLKRTEQG